MSIFSKILGTSPGPKKPYRAGTKLDGSDAEVLGAERTIELDSFLDLKAILSFECYGDEPIGGLLLQRRETVRVVFGFDVIGVHSFSLKDQLESTWEAIISATRTLPEGEPLGIRLSSFRSADRRMAQLYQQIQRCQNPRLDGLLMSEMANVDRLAKMGLRQPKHLEFFPTYELKEIEEFDGQSDKAINAVVSWIDAPVSQISGRNKSESDQSRAASIFS